MHRFVGCIGESACLDCLRTEIAEVVDNHCGLQLYEKWTAPLHRAIGSERSSKELFPDPCRFFYRSGRRRLLCGLAVRVLVLRGLTTRLVLAEDVSLDGLVEPPGGRPASEREEDHLAGIEGDTRIG